MQPSCNIKRLSSFWELKLVVFKFSCKHTHQRGCWTGWNATEPQEAGRSRSHTGDEEEEREHSVWKKAHLGHGSTGRSETSGGCDKAEWRQGAWQDWLQPMREPVIQSNWGLWYTSQGGPRTAAGFRYRWTCSRDDKGKECGAVCNCSDWACHLH